VRGGEGWTVTESRLLNRAIEAREFEQGREWLLDCLRERFPAELTAEVVDTINQQPSVSLLRSWHRSAVAARSYAEFLEAIRQ
jgi:hypothetical protein